MSELETNTHFRVGYLGLADAASVASGAATGAAAGSVVPGVGTAVGTLVGIAASLLPDISEGIEGIFASKTVRNRHRREWRDQAMKWLYARGVHKISDTGRDGRYNESIKKLVGLVAQDQANAVAVINQTIGNTITPDIVNQTLQNYVNLVGTQSLAGQATSGALQTAQLALSSFSIGDLTPWILGGGIVVGGLAIVYVLRKKRKKR